MVQMNDAGVDAHWAYGRPMIPVWPVGKVVVTYEFPVVGTFITVATTEYVLTSPLATGSGYVKVNVTRWLDDEAYTVTGVTDASTCELLSSRRWR